MIDFRDLYDSEDSYIDCKYCEGKGCNKCNGEGTVQMSIEEYKNYLIGKLEAENDLRHDELMEEHYKRKRDGK
jgi:hypothetical protein